MTGTQFTYCRPTLRAADVAPLRFATRLTLAVRLRVVKHTIARQGSKANRQPRHNGTAQVAVKRPAGRRGAGCGAGQVGGLPGGVAGPVCAVGPPNISSSRPPELAVAQVTGSRPAAAEQGR
jgi:hypothetical protein